MNLRYKVYGGGRLRHRVILGLISILLVVSLMSCDLLCPPKVTVSFDANGGVGTMGTVLLDVAEETTLPSNTFTRTGYTFSGWATTSSGTVAYTDGESFTMGTSNQTLYARWFSIPLILVEDGSFRMGSSENLSSDAYPDHQVIADSFYLGTYEVTQDIYEQVMESNPSYFTGVSLQVEQVSWSDAVVFCNALSVLDGLEAVYTISGGGGVVSCDWTKRGYRLPTEAEWEYAARGGAESLGYTFAGNDTVGDVAWYRDNSASVTHDVGGKDANELGLYDMNGNVAEWCWDWYGEDYYTVSPSANPTGPSSGSNRIYRGGYYSSLDSFVKPTFRDKNSSGLRDQSVGFRVLVPACVAH